VQLKDGYMLDPTGRLRITVGASEGKSGRRVVSLRANDFVVGRLKFVDYGEPECHWNNLACSKPGHQFDEGCEYICTELPPDEYLFEHAAAPDRVFIRAFARTTPKAGTLCASQTYEGRIARSTGQCIERLAFTNPIWVDNTVVPPPPPPPPVPGFSIACTSTKAPVLAGSSVISTCTVTSKDGFARPVTLACAGTGLSAAGPACAFSPATVTPTPKGAAASTLTVSIAASARPGGYSVRVVGTSTAPPCPICPSTTITGETAVAVVVGPAEPPAGDGALLAAFDAGLKAPSCGAVGWSCDTGTSLVMSRGLGGQELNAPNTLGATCLDGESGPTTGRWNGSDRIRVSTVDGSRFAPGAAVRVDATVWTTGSKTGALDVVDVFYTADAASPSWRLIGTAVLPASGPQQVSAFYKLTAGASQAVRVQTRPQGSAIPCNTGTSSDRDDLVFAVGN
jgi:hypothetical protein